MIVEGEFTKVDVVVKVMVKVEGEFTRVDVVAKVMVMVGGEWMWW